MSNLRIRKRSGQEVEFDRQKIVSAVERANRTVPVKEQLDEEIIQNIAREIEQEYIGSNTLPSVEGVQDAVIMRIMKAGAYRLAMNYTTYRYQHELRRKTNTTDEKVFAIVNGTSAEAKEENSNKNTDILPTQRDYIAGEVSRDLTRRYLLPQDIMEAHDKGLIHFHDGDYFIQHSGNCCLVNLDDMLQNGTVITGTLIERPHRFSTACNIATQIVAQVASNQFGGQTISLTHLAKFVNDSRKAIHKEVLMEQAETGVEIGEAQTAKIVERRLRREIRAGIQTIQYQVLTLMTTNGQAPFVTLYMYLNEAGDDELLKSDLAICIEEVLNQRIEGVKNEQGVWITPSFPKLIYVLEDNNICPDSPYFYLTELTAKCTAKRMVPDYISEKIMLRDKGDVYPCMGELTAHVKPEERKQKRCQKYLANGRSYISIVEYAS